MRGHIVTHFIVHCACGASCNGMQTRQASIESFKDRGWSFTRAKGWDCGHVRRAKREAKTARNYTGDRSRYE